MENGLSNIDTRWNGTGKATETGAAYDGAEWERSRMEHDKG